MEQPFDDVDEVYNQKLRVVLDLFTSKLPLYYSSSRLTLLLTLLDIPPGHFRPPPGLWRPTTGFWTHIISLPSRLEAMDSDALSFVSVSHFPAINWNIFRDFLDSGHPLALDGRRHATAASACLKIIFICDKAPHSRRTLRVNRSQRYHTDLKPKTLWHRSVRHWHLRTYLSNRKLYKFPPAFLEFQQKIRY
jgi:hypothetical protein